MIYTKLINRFWELDESWQFTGTETRLYFYLLKVAHSSHWECKRSDAKISSDVGVSVKIFKSARGRLVEADLIEYLQGNGRGNMSIYIIKGVPKGMQNLPTFSQKGVPKGMQILPTFSDDKGMQILPTFIKDSDCISSDCQKEDFNKGMQNLPTFSQKDVRAKENKENTPTPLKEIKENTAHFNKEKEKYKKEKDTPEGGMAELFPNINETPRRVKPKIEPPPYDDVLQYFRERIPDQEEASNMAYCFYEHFRSLGWRTSRGAKIEYWDSRANLWINDHYDNERRRTEIVRATPKNQSGASKESPQHSQDGGTDTRTQKDYNQTF